MRKASPPPPCWLDCPSSVLQPLQSPTPTPDHRQGPAGPPAGPPRLPQTHGMSTGPSLVPCGDLSFESFLSVHFPLQHDRPDKSSYHLSPKTLPHIPHTVHFIPVTLLFCNWKCVPLNRPHLFLSSPHPSGSHLFVLCICDSLFCYVCSSVLLFRFHVQVKSYSICLSLSDLFHLASYSLGPAMLSQVAKFHSLLWLVFHCVYTPRLLYPLTC